MDRLEKVMKSLTFEFLSKGSYKTTAEKFLQDHDSVLLDIRTQEEIETVSLNLQHHMQVLRIPLTELPERIGEIPRDKRVGLFCSSGVRIAMAYIYLRAAGIDNAVMVMGGLEGIVAELKPGKIRKVIEKKRS